MSLIEVLIALLILFISLMGSAAMQLNALKHTASALISTQDSFIAYSRLDQMRAEVVHLLSSGHAGAGSS